MKNGPIILIEDDLDDQEFITDALKLSGIDNHIEIFDNGEKALTYLLKSDQQPFIILSDVNLPVMNGLQLKFEIQKNEYLRNKSIPFIFLSTSADAKAVQEAFELNAQGFFEKEITFEGIQRQLEQIISYWKTSRHPNSNK